MKFITCIKDTILHVKKQLQENSVDSILWIVNIIPKFAGFSLQKDKITVFTPFWILHLFLLSYIYGVGNLVYQLYFAHGASDFIKSYVNIALLILIANNSYWFLKQWSMLKIVLKKIKESDELARRSPQFREKHVKLLSAIKKIILIFYSFNYVDATFIYVPHRSDVKNEFSMTPCVGLEPLTSSPNKEICTLLLGVQELTIMSVVLNYQALLLFLIDHTAAMYHMLSEEMMVFNSADVDNEYVKEKLPQLIRRHALTLEIVHNLKDLYSVPIGVNFGSNALCMSLFFFLSFQEWLGFIPIVVYCFLVFFLYCFLCQRLINAAEGFEREVYSCGWEHFERKEQKTIFVMLIQAQKKVEILAAGIIPVNIYTFATTLQAMYKFVTVVKL